MLGRLYFMDSGGLATPRASALLTRISSSLSQSLSSTTEYLKHATIEEQRFGLLTILDTKSLKIVKDA